MTEHTGFEPMTAGMILDATVRIYARRLWTLLGIAAIAYIPQLLLVLMVVVASLVGDVLGGFIALISALGYLVTWLIVYPLATGAASFAVSQTYLGEEPDVRKAFRVAWDNVGTLFLASLIVGLIVLVGLLLLVIPGVIWWLSYSLIVPVIILENQNSEGARHRSSQLTSGHRGKIFVVLAIIIILQLVGQFGALGVLTLFVGFEHAFEGVAGQITQRVLEIVVTPLQLVAIVLIYYDLRIRKEGFDLEMLSGAIRRPPVASTLGLT